MVEIGKRAVVLGGSMAGLFAARVLAESYQDVRIVDRDTLLGVREARRGAPHARHAHSLHGEGQRIMEELFPGMTAELDADGYPTGDLGKMRWYFNGRALRRTQSGVTSVTPPRPVLEDYVRNKVAALPNVQFLERYDIIGLVASPDRGTITGARVQRREQGAEEEQLDADLVVDTTGRGSRTPVWLDELGYPRPEEERLKIGLAYTTRFYRLRPGMLDGLQSINPVASPAHPRGAFFGRASEDSCIVSLTGILGDHPPTDPDGFLEFARTLPVRDVYEGIRDAEPLTDPVRFQFPASVRLRYERLSRFPAGFLVMGDAVCSFNPVYGQGMSVAALQAETLRSHLRRGDPVAARRFFADVSRVIDAPWEVSAGGDLDFPEVEGERTPQVRIGNGYVARVQYAATKDPAVTTGFMRVAGLIDRPQDLMKPAMAARVLRHAFRRPEPAPSWLDTAPADTDRTASGSAV